MCNNTMFLVMAVTILLGMSLAINGNVTVLSSQPAKQLSYLLMMALTLPCCQLRLRLILPGMQHLLKYTYVMNRLDTKLL